MTQPSLQCYSQDRDQVKDSPYAARNVLAKGRRGYKIVFTIFFICFATLTIRKTLQPPIIEKSQPTLHDNSIQWSLTPHDDDAITHSNHKNGDKDTSSDSNDK